MKLLLILFLGLLTVQDSLASDGDSDSCQGQCGVQGTDKCDTEGQCVCKDGYAGEKCMRCVSPYTKGKSGKCKIRGEKILVVNGWADGNGQSTEIIDLEDSGFSCILPKKFPTQLEFATGGLVSQKPFVCGGDATNEGRPPIQDCYTLKEEGSWKKDKESILSTGRHFARSVVMNDELVIVGGKTGWPWGGKILTTIEVAKPNKAPRTLSGIELPVDTYTSCIVPWDANTFMVIGGNPTRETYAHNYHDSSKRTYFVDMTDNTVTDGPDLINARFRHACSEMTVKGEKFIIVTGGLGLGGSGGMPSKTSTEYLSKSNYDLNSESNGGWQVGTDLPVPIYDHQMVSSPDNQYVYTIGTAGWCNSVRCNTKEIYKYSCNGRIIDCEWTKIETQLKYGRTGHVAFAIPNFLANKLCKK